MDQDQPVTDTETHPTSGAVSRRVLCRLETRSPVGSHTGLRPLNRGPVLLANLSTEQSAGARDSIELQNPNWGKVDGASHNWQQVCQSNETLSDFAVGRKRELVDKARIDR